MGLSCSSLRRRLDGGWRADDDGLHGLDRRSGRGVSAHSHPVVGPCCEPRDGVAGMGTIGRRTGLFTHG
ncbi:uncharacterized protein BDV14DRAFT_186372 [Aspergillus stella-maris]|uniref:uncharacterized protein n=1 Tax=Aspergillus stella-maris TaxID=1810926 RepID=UPI003CCE33F9